MSRTYDPKTGVWTENTEPEQTSTSQTPQTPQTTDSTGSNLTSSTSDPTNSTGSVEKQYNNTEINTLSGELNFIATNETIKLKVGDTVKLLGLGSSLSGDYYVQDIVRKIDSNGYSHSATVIKTDFGSTLKIKTESVTGESTPVIEEKTEPSTPQASTAQRTYTVVKGDSLYKIAKQFYNDGSQWNKIYDANTGKVANPNLIYVGQVFVIP